MYLLQKYDNGDFYVYAWTSALAQKGYNVLEDGAAKEYLALQAEGKNNVRHLKDLSEWEEARQTNEKSGWIDPEEIDVEDIIEFEEGEDNPIAAEVAEVEAPVDEGEVEIDAFVEQEDILAQELKYVKGMSHKSTVERHMLEKYRLEVPTGTLQSMKALTNQMLTDLANDGKLYLVDRQVKLR